MKVTLSKSRIQGRVTAPSSKSYTIRGLMCAAMAPGESEIVRPLGSDDTAAAAGVLRKIGVNIQEDRSWKVSGGKFLAPRGELFCGDSAATLRFMTAICAIVPGECRLTVGPSLARRPVRPLVDALKPLGVEVSCNGKVAPVTVKGGRLQGGVTEIAGNISSQFVSALLLVAPFAENGVRLRLTAPLESKPYVLMTNECLRKFGIKVSETADGYEVKKQSYNPARYVVEGDWSSASYFLALGAVAGEVEVANLNRKSLQGDKAILDFLREMGADIEARPNAVVVRKARLKAIQADLTDCIDLLPTVAVLAALAKGTSQLSGIARARLKESDRVAAVAEGLTRMGIKVEVQADKLAITGASPKSAVLDSKGDHRMAMAFSIPGVLAGTTTIAGAECVSKTFPEYWSILQEIGGKLKIDE